MALDKDISTAVRPTDRLLRQLLILGVLVAPFNFFLGIPIGGATIHPLHLWSLLAITMALIARPRILVAGCDAPALLFWTMFVFVLCSTLLGTPNIYRTRGLLDVALLAINLGAFTVIRGQLRGGSLWMSAAKAVFLASALASGLLAIRAVQVARTGLFESPDSYMLGLGTVVGTFSSAFAASGLALATFSTSGRLRLVGMAGFVINGLTAGLALARGPWLALGASVLITFPIAAWMLRRRFAVVRRLSIALLAFVLMVPVAVALVLVNSSLAQLLSSRFLQVANLGTGTGLDRLILFKSLLQAGLDSPLFGHGAATYREVSELLGVQGSVSENFVLEMFHAGGLAATMPLVIALSIIVVRPFKVLLAAPEPAIVVATVTGLFAMVLGALTNPAGWDTLFWVLLALTVPSSPSVALVANDSTQPVLVENPAT